MSQELHYTSVPRGLKPGSRGFATVAVTAGLPDSLAERLEGLSGYQAVYPPGDPSAGLNPVVHAHVRLAVGGEVLDVLSRVGPAGLDYSGRPSKYAHHVVLGAGELPAGGPAWLLSRPGFLQAAWEGEPRILAAGRTPPRGDRTAEVAEAWRARAGDAGWAGVLAESFLADPRRPVFLVFQPGIDLLPLIVEAIALVPASRRWEVEFSTYYTGFPPGVSCAWRGVLEESREVKDARRLPRAMIVDLCRPLGRAQGGELVDLARTGQHRERSGSGSLAASAPPATRVPPVPASRPVPGLEPPGRTAPARPAWPAADEPFPDLAVRTDEIHPWLPDEASRQRRRRRRRTQAAVATILAACLAPLLVASVYYQSAEIRSRPGLAPESRPTSIGGVSGRSKIPGDPPVPPVGPPGGRARDQADGPGEPTGKPEARSLPVASAGNEADRQPGEGGTDQPNAPVPDPARLLAGNLWSVIRQDGGAAGGDLATSRGQGPVGARAGSSPSGPSGEPSAQSSAGKPAPQPPMILALPLPAVTRSTFGPKTQPRAELSLPEEVWERFKLLNAPDFQVIPPSGNQSWAIAGKTENSRLAQSFTLAQLSRLDSRTWSFEWTKEARNQPTRVEALRDAVLRFETPDGRAIWMLLRELEPRDRQPLTILDNQPLLPERGESRTRSVAWTHHPDSLAGSRWKPVIRRWKVVIAGPDAEGRKPFRRVVEPAPVGSGGARDGAGSRTGSAALEQGVIPREVTIKLAIDSTNPGLITVRLDVDRNRVREGRADRAARWNVLQEATPRDREGRERNPIHNRRDRLRQLDEETKRDEEAIKLLRKEIVELEAILEIQQVERLLSNPARTELSVVIGLEVDAAPPLDIAGIGELAD